MVGRFYWSVGWFVSSYGVFSSADETDTWKDDVDERGLLIHMKGNTNTVQVNEEK